MHLFHLEEFAAVADHHSMTAAADHLGMSQPTLSKHITALEAEVGSPLFSRNAKQLELTEEGRIFYGFAKGTLEQYARTKEQITEIKASAPIRIGGRTQDPRITAALRMILGTTQIRLQVVQDYASDKSAADLLSNGELDVFIGIPVTPDKSKHWKAVPLFSNQPQMAVFTSDDPLSCKEGVTLADLRDHTFLSLVNKQLAPGWEMLKEACLEHGFQMKERFVPVNAQLNEIVLPQCGEVMIYGNANGELNSLITSEKWSVVPLQAFEALAEPLGVGLVYQAKDTTALAPFIAAMKSAARQIREESASTSEKKSG